MADIFNMADTWNDGGTTFTAVKMNVTDTASAAASSLLDLQVGGTSKLRVDKSGNVVMASGAAVLGGTVSNTGGALTLAHANGDDVRVRNNGASNLPVLGFYNGSNAIQTSIAVEAQDVLAQRRTTNPQAFRLYNTFTDASNYERGEIIWSSNELLIRTGAAGTGTNRDLRLTSQGGTFFVNAVTNTIIRGNASATNLMAALGLGASANVPDVFLFRVGAGVARMAAAAGGGTGAVLEFLEQTAPAAGAANTARIFAEDNGSGKTRLMVQFNSGAAQQIAIEP